MAALKSATAKAAEAAASAKVAEDKKTPPTIPDITAEIKASGKLSAVQAGIPSGLSTDEFSRRMRAAIDQKGVSGSMASVPSSLFR